MTVRIGLAKPGGSILLSKESHPYHIENYRLRARGRRFVVEQRWDMLSLFVKAASGLTLLRCSFDCLDWIRLLKILDKCS